MVKILPGIISTANSDGAVLLDSSRDEMTVVNPMGSYVLGQLELGLSVDQIIEELARTTTAAKATVEEDLKAFLGDLLSKRLVSIH